MLLIPTIIFIFSLVFGCSISYRSNFIHELILKPFRFFILLLFDDLFLYQVLRDYLLWGQSRIFVFQCIMGALNLFLFEIGLGLNLSALWGKISEIFFFILEWKKIPIFGCIFAIHKLLCWEWHLIFILSIFCIPLDVPRNNVVKWIIDNLAGSNLRNRIAYGPVPAFLSLDFTNLQ